jgi:hypothetical protein
MKSQNNRQGQTESFFGMIAYSFKQLYNNGKELGTVGPCCPEDYNWAGWSRINI